MTCGSKKRRGIFVRHVGRSIEAAFFVFENRTRRSWWESLLFYSMRHPSSLSLATASGPEPPLPPPLPPGPFATAAYPFFFDNFPITDPERPPPPLAAPPSASNARNILLTKDTSSRALKGAGEQLSFLSNRILTFQTDLRCLRPGTVSGDRRAGRRRRRKGCLGC